MSMPASRKYQYIEDNAYQTVSSSRTWISQDIFLAMDYFGTITYSYDAENRLQKTCGDTGVGVEYAYDNNGNLLSQTSSFTNAVYEYNQQNRMVRSRVIDDEARTMAKAIPSSYHTNLKMILIVLVGAKCHTIVWRKRKTNEEMHCFFISVLYCLFMSVLHLLFTWGRSTFPSMGAYLARDKVQGGCYWG